jgi:hypothetical protein
MISKNNIDALRWFRITAFLSLIVFLFASCDKVTEPYRTKVIVENTDTVACPVPEFSEVTSYVKHVLLEDYTGHFCVNCPRAAVIAHNLKEEYGDQVILMAVHAGDFAKPGDASGSYSYDFRTPAGTEWDNHFGIGAEGNPNGMVNRRKIGSTYVIAPSDWGGAVSSMLAEEALLDIQVINDYTPGEKKLCTHIRTQFRQAIDKNLKLVLAITEDSIVAAQRNNDPTVGATPEILNYVHMHVLRGTLTSTWGTDIAATGSEYPESVIKSYRFEFNENWIPENCHVVAFVYDADTYEVLQASEAAVISE